jgi:nucleotide-binding universal stress UspA family protein
MRMLICSIGSKKRKATLRFAAGMAKALASEVIMLGVVDKERKVEQLGLTMDEVARDLTDHDLPVQVRVEVGDAEKIVMAEIQEGMYDLTALGALAGKRARQPLLGSVSRRVLERAEGSVMLVKGDRKDVKRVLICSSGTDRGRLSVWTGAAVACAMGAEATLLHVLDPMPAMYTGLERMEETLAEFLQSDTEVSKELKWGSQVVKAECMFAELKLRRGIVADEVLREAEQGDHDLIVLGSSRSAGGIVRMLMGDLTAEVVSRAKRPVLVVRPQD